MSVCPSCPLCVDLAPPPSGSRWPVEGENSSQMWLKMSQKKTMILNDFTTPDEIRRVHIFTLRLHKLQLRVSGMTESGQNWGHFVRCSVSCIIEATPYILIHCGLRFWFRDFKIRLTSAKKLLVECAQSLPSHIVNNPFISFWVLACKY